MLPDPDELDEEELLGVAEELDEEELDEEELDEEELDEEELDEEELDEEELDEEELDEEELDEEELDEEELDEEELDEEEELTIIAPEEGTAGKPGSQNDQIGTEDTCAIGYSPEAS